MFNTAMKRAAFIEGPQTFIPHTAARAFIGPGMTRLADGDILMAAPWGRPPTDFEQLAATHPVPMLYRSHDGGRTWREDGRMRMDWSLPGMISDGGITFLRLEDGRLAFLAHRHVQGLHGGGAAGHRLLPLGRRAAAARVGGVAGARVPPLPPDGLAVPPRTVRCHRHIVERGGRRARDARFGARSGCAVVHSVPPLAMHPRTVRSAGAQRLRGAGCGAGAQSCPSARLRVCPEPPEPADGSGAMIPRRWRILHLDPGDLPLAARRRLLCLTWRRYVRPGNTVDNPVQRVQ
jgi:hypothetical protein